MNFRRINQGICYFCNGILTQTDDMYSPSGYIHICQACNNGTEHIFYTGRTKALCLTLRTLLQLGSHKYILYLYPNYEPGVLIQSYDDDQNRPTTIMTIESMNNFTAHNMKDQLARLLKLKAFI